MSAGSRRQALQALRLVHPRPEAVTSPLFRTQPLLSGLGQGAGEIRDAAGACPRRRDHDRRRGRARLLQGRVLPGCCGLRGSGMTGLLDERSGRKGPVKLTAEVLELLERSWPVSGGRGGGGHRVGRLGVRPASQDHSAGPAAMSRYWRTAEPPRPTTRGCGPPWSPPEACPTSRGRGPFRPAGPGRPDRLAGRAAGVCRRLRGAARPAWSRTPIPASMRWQPPTGCCWPWMPWLATPWSARPWTSRA